MLTAHFYLTKFNVHKIFIAKINKYIQTNGTFTCPFPGFSWFVSLIFSKEITCDVIYSPDTGDSGCSYIWSGFMASPTPDTIQRELERLKVVFKHPERAANVSSSISVT